MRFPYIVMMGIIFLHRGAFAMDNERQTELLLGGQAHIAEVGQQEGKDPLLGIKRRRAASCATSPDNKGAFNVSVVSIASIDLAVILQGDSDVNAIRAHTDSSTPVQPTSAVAIDQADLAKKLLDNTDDLRPWSMGQKVGLGVSIAVVAVAVSVGGYFLYHKLHTVPQEGNQQPDDYEASGPAIGA